jgi:hypothetical protein
VTRVNFNTTPARISGAAVRKPEDLFVRLAHCEVRGVLRKDLGQHAEECFDFPTPAILTYNIFFLDSLQVSAGTQAITTSTLSSSLQAYPLAFCYSYISSKRDPRGFN